MAQEKAGAAMPMPQHHASSRVPSERDALQNEVSVHPRDEDARLWLAAIVDSSLRWSCFPNRLRET